MQQNVGLGKGEIKAECNLKLRKPFHTNRTVQAYGVHNSDDLCYYPDDVGTLQTRTPIQLCSQER